MVSFRGVRSKAMLATTVLCGSLLLTPLATSAKDVKVVIERNLSDAVLLTQGFMASAAQGCSGGPNGKAPLNWGGRQASGVAAQNALNDLRVALAGGQTEKALQLQ